MIFKCPSHIGVKACLLGLNGELEADFFCNTDLVHILLHSVQKSILVVWIADKAHTPNQWLHTVTDIILLKHSPQPQRTNPSYFTGSEHPL